MSDGEFLTRGTIFAALVLSVLGSAYRLRAGDPRHQRWTRWAWTAAALAYLVHVLAAFHFSYDWSHAVAYQATARQTAELFGVHWGGGLFVNYAFTAAWILDVVWRWLKPEAYGRSPRALVLGWQAFFLFIVFNATVVFGTAPARWLGAIVCLALIALWWLPLSAARA